MMGKEIPLTRGAVTIVDYDTYDELSIYKWHVDNKGYARKGVNKKGEKFKAILMHRIINQTPKGLLTDHINGNKLDNRKCNLRTATHTQSLANRRSFKNSTSKYKGVWWSKDMNKWKSEVCVNGEIKYSEYFHSEKEAAHAYDKAAIKYHGDYAYLNFRI